MFSTLDRVDIVLGADDGSTILGQTDHRTAEDVEATPELSVLFAIARIVNARRGEEAAEKIRVVYMSQFEPPELLKRVIGCLGAELFVDQRPFEIESPPGDIAPLLDETLVSLAERTRKEQNAPFDVASLERLERTLSGTPSPEEDEPAYWSAVMKLGSFAGQVIRKLTRCRWIVDDEGGIVPMALMVKLPSGEARVDPMNRAANRLAGGENDMRGLVASLSKHLRSSN